MNYVVYIFILVLLFCIYILIRNNQVAKLRNKILHEDSAYALILIYKGMDLLGHYHRRYESLPSYDAMVFMFWIPISKFESKLKPIETYYDKCFIISEYKEVSK